MYFNLRNEYREYLLENKKEGSAYKIINGVVMGRLASACWYTNLDHKKRHEELILYNASYQPDENLSVRWKRLSGDISSCVS